MHKKLSAITIKGFALLVVLGTVYRAMSQDAVTPYPITTYPKMAPIEMRGPKCGDNRDVHHCHSRWSEAGGEVGFEGKLK